jgi:hypothetical protein
MRITSRLGGLGLALVSSLLLLGLFSGAASASVTGYCTSGTTQWNGGDGSWGAGNWSTSSGNWSNGYPSSACDTVINGNVTVTFTTISDHYGNEDTANAGGLTLSGGATLVVQGESDDVQGNWYNATNLNVGADGLSIGQGSTLELEASNATATPVQGTLTGGTANLTVDSGSSGPANLTNNGAIVASTSDAAWGESLNDGGTVANNGSLTDQSGQLTMQGQGNTAYVFDNSGSYTVASGASAQMIAGDGSAFTNTGTIANQGTFTLQQSMHWNQNGGSDTGNPVELTGGETLEDSSGAGSFEWTNCTTAGLNGTIPANQTITVVGGCSGTTLFISPGSTTPVANHGTIILEAPAGASDGILSGNAELDNYGTIDSNVGGALPLGNQLLLPLVNESGGTVNLSGGELEQTSGSATTNNGTVDIGPGSTWLVQGGSFTNAGAIGLQIAGASNLGTFNLTAGSKFTAGGTLAAALASGYQPAAGTEFPIITENGGSPSGTFGSVSGGFSADYTKETASPGYVGLVYGTAGPAANPTPTPTTTSTIPKAVLPTATRISGGARSLLFKLTCPRSAAAACAYALSGTVGRRRVAAGHGVVKPGRSITVTLRLNRIGATLLRHHRRLRVEVLVRSGAATIKTSTVTVTRSGAAKKKK